MRMLRLFAAVVLSLGSVLLVAPPAQAAGAPVVAMTIKAVADRSGVITVTQTMTYDFGTSGGHGPYLYWTTRQAMDNDPGHWRVYDYTVQRVTSSTGAPTRASQERGPDYLALRIGDPNRTVTGRQTYEILYTVDGIVNPNVAQQGGGVLDEIFWTVIGTGWVVPLNDITVTLTGPATITDATCWTGSAFKDRCTDVTKSDIQAIYVIDRLAPGEGLAIVAGWPAGTFPAAAPILAERNDPPTFFNPVGTGVGGAVGVLGLVGVLLASRRNRDQQYVGLTPGLSPAPGQETSIGYAGRTPVAVQFTPPSGLAPGMIGTVIDERAENRDVTATIVDLAVRGFLRFEDISAQTGSRNDFRLVRTSGRSPLLPYENRIFERLFASGDVVGRDDLEARYFGTDMARTRRDLYDAVTQAGWFRGNPESVRTTWRVGGIALMGLGIFGTGPLSAVGLAPVGVAAGLIGLAVLVLSGSAPARTAEGHAVTTQARGFRQYLETAEADQIRFEEGEDIFSRYLPYAIAFGCADRWAKVFQELAARGVPLPTPTWYVGPNFYYGGFGGGFDSVIDSLDSFSQAAATVQTQSTSGSSGFSGFSGGGGGVGGGGGGSW